MENTKNLGKEIRSDDFVSIMDSAMNSFCPRIVPTDVAAGILRLHRTMQASIVRFMWDTLVAIGCSKDAGVDLRNQAAISLCRRVAEINDVDDIYIPMI